MSELKDWFWNKSRNNFDYNDKSSKFNNNTIKFDSLKIVIWNTNRLLQHTLEITVYLETQQFDILLILETHFTKKNYFSMPKYRFYFAMYPDNAFILRMVEEQY